MSKTASFGMAAVLAAALAAPVAAQNTSADKDKVKALVEQAMAQVQGTTPQPQGTRVVQAPGGPVVELTAEQAVARALERNLTLASQRITPRTFDYSLSSLRANYRLTLTSTMTNTNAVNLPTSIFAGGSRVTVDTKNWNYGVTQNVPWGGGNYTVTWNNSRAFSDASDTTFNPNYNSNLRANFTQPLLRNFRIDNNRTQLQTTEIQQDQAEIDLRATVASTVAQVRNAYWELVYGYQAVEAAQQSLDLAAKLVSDNRARVEIGTMAPIDIVQAQAEEAARRQQLVVAQATLRNNELALKRLIVSGTDDDMWRSTISPVDRPSPTAEPIDLEAAVANALSQRTDLLTTRKSMDSQNITLRSQLNQSLPQLDLIGIYNLQGRGGTAIQRDRATNLPVNTFPGGYWDAISAIGNFDAPTWTVQMNFSYPLGTSSAQANAARTRLLIQQNEATIKSTELQIATDVTTAALNIQSAIESVQAATASRELSEKRLEAAQSKLEVGMATNFEVVQAQRDLNDARNSELRALLNYSRALVDFQRAQISPR